MAPILNNTVGFKIQNGGTYVDLSNHVKSATINTEFEQLEVTAMGAGSRQYVAGLQVGTLTLSFINDDSASSVMQTLNALNGTTAAFKLVQIADLTASPSTATISAQNPLYTATVLVNHLTPIQGDVGAISVQDLTLTINSVVTVSNSGTW